MCDSFVQAKHEFCELPPTKLSNLRTRAFSALSVNQEIAMGMKSLKNKQPRKGDGCWGHLGSECRETEARLYWEKWEMNSGKVEAQSKLWTCQKVHDWSLNINFVHPPLVCFCVCPCLSHCMYGCQKTACRNGFSPSPTWAPGTKPRLSGSVAGTFTLGLISLAQIDYLNDWHSVQYNLEWGQRKWMCLALTFHPRTYAFFSTPLTLPSSFCFRLDSTGCVLFWSQKLHST